MCVCVWGGVCVGVWVCGCVGEISKYFVTRSMFKKCIVQRKHAVCSCSLRKRLMA